MMLDTPDAESELFGAKEEALFFLFAPAIG